jgi:putative ABC transport system substrate-binding protein
MASHIGRRKFLATLGGAAAAWPLAARAQHPERMRRVAFLTIITQNDPDVQLLRSAFHDRLHELGWLDGRDIRIDYRWAGPDVENLRAHATELVRSNPDLIVADSTAALTVLRPLSGDIPVVFLRVSDPVGVGFVNSLARPGGNLTGITNFEFAMGGKWLQLLKQIAPLTSRVTALLYPGMIAHDGFWRTIEAAAAPLTVEARAILVRHAADIEGAIVAAAGAPNNGVILLPHAIIETNRFMIIEMAARHQLPAIYPLRHYAAAGGLIAYGLEPRNLYRQVAVYVDRVLRGARPAELPVQQPTRFELAINLRTARALGLDVPPSLLAIADEVIE